MGKAIVGGILLGSLALQAWTQLLALHYGYHAALGLPVWTVQAFYRQHGLYVPWAAVGWTWRWSGWQVQLSLLAGGLAVLALVGVIAWRKWRALDGPPPMTGYGDGAWATKADAKKAGLL
jgi:hypothetical protein